MMYADKFPIRYNLYTYQPYIGQNVSLTSRVRVDEILLFIKLLRNCTMVPEGFPWRSILVALTVAKSSGLFQM